jgi:hypothetical protein
MFHHRGGLQLQRLSFGRIRSFQNKKLLNKDQPHEKENCYTTLLLFYIIHASEFSLPILFKTAIPDKSAILNYDNTDTS